MPNRDWMDLATWKALAAEGRAPRDALLRKQFASETRAVADDERAVAIAISTEDPDRDKDTLALDGWDLRNYRRNPIVLWAHDYKSLPIARATSIGVADGAL